MITLEELFMLELPTTLHYTTEKTMDNFWSMDWFIKQLGMADQVTLFDGSYSEVEYEGKHINIHAGGDGDMYSHNFKIEEI